MLNTIDLMIGAVGIRLIRKYKKMRKIPDVIFVRKNLAYGGKTPYKELLNLNIKTVIDLRAEKINQNKENELVQYHKFQIIDGGIPTKSQISRIHKIIEENEKKRTRSIHSL
jgi:protein-tyrosine phosphatase